MAADGISGADRHIFEGLLNEVKRSLTRQIQEFEQGSLGESLGDSIGELSTYDNHPADIGTETFERGKDIALRGTVLSRLGEVDEALGRLRSGVYGTCADCGRPIPRERLLAKPETSFCVDCAAVREEAEGPRTPEGRRPAEEARLERSYRRLYSETPGDFIGYDQEDAWQDVARYGTSDTPQDVPGSTSPEDAYLSAHEPVGTVEPVESLPAEPDHEDEFISEDDPAARESASGSAAPMPPVHPDDTDEDAPRGDSPSLPR